MFVQFREIVRRIAARLAKKPESSIQDTSVSLKSAPTSFAPPNRKDTWLKLPMLLPHRTILVWNDVPDAKKNVSPQTQCASLMFGFEHRGQQLTIAVKRPLSEDFSATRMKIQMKLMAAMSPPTTKATRGAPPVLDGNVNLDLVPDINPDYKTFGSVIASSSSFNVAGLPYTLLREPVDISSVTCNMTPIVGCPTIPIAEFRADSDATVQPTIHWYVQDSLPESEKDETDSKTNKAKRKKAAPPQPPGKIDITDELSRSFSVPGYSYVGTGPIYFPTAADVGKHLVMVADIGPKAIVRCGISKHTVQSGVDGMIFEERLRWCEQPVEQGCYRVVSYNILADLYLNLAPTQDQLFFPYCPKEYQQLDYRYPSILREIKGYRADILFLQEVDHRMQLRYLAPLLDSMDTTMCYAKKAKEVNEGVVTAFNRNKFSLISSEWFWLADLLKYEPGNEDVRQVLSTSEESTSIACTRPTIVQIVAVREVSTGNVIILANTHLHHNPRHEHLKAVQALIARRKIEQGRESLAAELNLPVSSVRVLFAGDFNSTPDGAVYELFTQGKLSSSNKCWSLDHLLIPTELKLSSTGAEFSFLNLSGCPEYTNYTAYKHPETGAQVGFVGTLDYVWTNPEGAELRRQAPHISHDDVIRYEALPSKISPSDHLPLIIEVAFTK